ncbi:hypothetical protein O3Q51_12300 [Cryomorphaceae bacterium 1068]|nr:hypothetical protein [Cryomorphaceae bacterium 1068]
MIHLIFHTPPTNTSMRQATEDVMTLFENIGKANRDDENDNFYFVLDAHRELGAELKQSLEEMGYNVSVKDYGVYLV